MKKYSILTVSLAIACSLSYAQQRPAESPSVNKGGEPTINGMPYSQYKAKVLAKQQQESKIADVQMTTPKLPVSPSGTWNNKPVDNAVKNVPVDNTITAKPVQDNKPSATAKISNRQMPVAMNGNDDLLRPVPADAVVAGTNNVVAQPEVKIDKTRTQPIEEVKPSVIPVQPKLPVVPMQSEKAKGKN